MQLKIGIYAFAVGSNKITAGRRVLVNKGGQLYAYELHWQIHGYLYCNGQADASAQIAALNLALSIPYQNVALYNDDGSLSGTVMQNQGSTTGVLVVDGPNYPLGEYGAIYSTEVPFDFSVRAEFPFTGTANLLLDFHEELHFAGGLPIFVCKPSLNTVAQRQRTAFREPYKATQQGSITGYLKYPTIPAPIWPNYLAKAPETARKSPERKGNVPAAYQGYTIDYAYTFESPYILSGTPNLWIK